MSVSEALSPTPPRSAPKLPPMVMPFCSAAAMIHVPTNLAARSAVAVELTLAEADADALSVFVELAVGLAVDPEAEELAVDDPEDPPHAASDRHAIARHKAATTDTTFVFQFLVFTVMVAPPVCRQALERYTN